MNSNTKICIRSFLIGSILLLLFGIATYLHQNIGSHGGDLTRILDDGELIVITRNANTTYYEDADGLAGMEYELAMQFAEYLGVHIRFKIIDSVNDIILAMKKGKGDIAAAGLTRTVGREKDLKFGPDYYHTRQLVIVHKDSSDDIHSLKDLKNRSLYIIEGSSYEERMNELKAEDDSLRWSSVYSLSIEEILEKISEKKVAATVVDENIFNINRRYYPELRVAIPISEEQPISWIVGIYGDTLKQVLEEWFSYMKETGQLQYIIQKYYGHISLFDYVDILTYHNRIETRLPDCIDWFLEAEEKYAIPWTLIAAQSYQESHWNPNAVSPTGVRGIMMLTQRTALQMGILNRLDPYHSIMGGAHYLSRMLRRIPSSVTGDDRIRFALAAYNVGIGHINDARQLAVELGLDPDKWSDLKKVLPLLAQSKYYKNLTHGYARGLEPVHYVDRIYNYRQILENNINPVRQ